MYNPYLYNMSYMPASKGILSSINFSSILTNAQKTLNVVNQTIPLIKQAGPIVKNARTMFKVMNEFKKVETPVAKVTEEEKNIIKNDVDFSGKPVFFI